VKVTGRPALRRVSEASSGPLPYTSSVASMPQRRRTLIVSTAVCGLFSVDSRPE